MIADIFWGLAVWIVLALCLYVGWATIRAYEKKRDK